MKTSPVVNGPAKLCFCAHLPPRVKKKGKKADPHDRVDRHDNQRAGIGVQIDVHEHRRHRVGQIEQTGDEDRRRFITREFLLTHALPTPTLQDPAASAGRVHDDKPSHRASE